MSNHLLAKTLHEATHNLFMVQQFDLIKYFYFYQLWQFKLICIPQSQVHMFLVKVLNSILL